MLFCYFVLLYMRQEVCEEIILPQILPLSYTCSCAPFSLSELQAKVLLTGSAEDEMFPRGHYGRLFSEISSEVNDCAVHIFEHGGHPAMLSNAENFVLLLR